MNQWAQPYKMTYIPTIQNLKRSLFVEQSNATYCLHYTAVLENIVHICHSRHLCLKTTAPNKPPTLHGLSRQTIVSLDHELHGFNPPQLPRTNDFIPFMFPSPDSVHIHCLISSMSTNERGGDSSTVNAPLEWCPLGKYCLSATPWQL